MRKTVTSEDRYIMELSELHTVRFDCTNEKCGTTISFRMADWTKFPEACPICKTTWYNSQSSDEYQTIGGLLYNLQQAMALMDAKRTRPVGFRVRFELNRPK
jgi:hypothetical protein